MNFSLAFNKKYTVPGAEVSIWDGSGKQILDNNYSHLLLGKGEHLPLDCTAYSCVQQYMMFSSAIYVFKERNQHSI